MRRCTLCWHRFIPSGRRGKTLCSGLIAGRESEKGPEVGGACHTGTSKASLTGPGGCANTFLCLAAYSSC